MDKFFVADSYKDATIVGEPFKNAQGRMIVKIVHNCPRCGGTGHYSYNSLDGTVCYGCGGSGKTTQTVRAYTEKEYLQMKRNNERARAKKVAAREAKERELILNADKYQHELALKLGFNEDEKAYIVCGGDTYAIKDMLKEAGGHFNPTLKWYLPKKINLPESYKFCEIDFCDVYNYMPLSKRAELKENVATIVRELIAAATGDSNTKFYPAEVGNRIHNIEATVENIQGFDGHYGYTTILILTCGNYKFVWITTKLDLNLEVGDKVSVSGTIKKFMEYNGINQTHLTRCIIVKK